MRKRTKEPLDSDDEYEYVDPTPFIERLVPNPHWIEECNDFSLTYIGQFADQDEITEGVNEVKKQIERSATDRMDELMEQFPSPEKEYRPEGMDVGSTKTFAESFADAVGDFGDITQLFNMST